MLEDVRPRPTQPETVRQGEVRDDSENTIYAGFTYLAEDGMGGTLVCRLGVSVGATATTTIILTSTVALKPRR